MRDDVQEPFERRDAIRAIRVADGVDLIEPGGFRTLEGLGEHPLPGDQDAGPAVAEMEGHFRRPEQDVQRYHDGTRLEDPEVGDEELRDVGQLQRDGVPGLHPGRRQGGREPVRRPVQLPVGKPATVVHRHRVVW